VVNADTDERQELRVARLDVAGPSSNTLALGGSMARPIFAGVLAEMLIIDAGKDANPALATSTARPATRVSGSVR
jgi:hypothetical protein